MTITIERIKAEVARFETEYKEKQAKEKITKFLNTTDENGFLPLYYAKDICTAKSFVELGADINQKYTTEDVGNILERDSFYDLIEFLPKGPEKNEFVSELIERFNANVNTSLVSYKSNQVEEIGQRSVLHLAIYNNDFDVALILLEKGADCKIDETIYYDEPLSLFKRMTGICDSLTNYWSNDYFKNFFEQTEKADLIFLEIAKKNGNLDFIEEDINNSVYNIMLLMNEHEIDSTHAEQIIRKRFQDIAAFKDKFKEMKNELNQFKKDINSFARVASPDVINERTLLPNELMYKVT